MHKKQVRRFYEVIWNAHNKGVMPLVLHEDFTFRGSLGQEKQGHSGFAEYVDMVHKALRDYKCILLEIHSVNQVAYQLNINSIGLHLVTFIPKDWVAIEINKGINYNIGG